jgi:hypothetical protein
MPKYKRTTEEMRAIERNRIEEILVLPTGTLEYVKGAGLAYDGVPEWCEEDHDTYGRDFMTVVRTIWGPEKVLTLDDGSVWDLQATYNSLGERECPIGVWRNDGCVSDPMPKVTRKDCILTPGKYRKGRILPNAWSAECPMCEEKPGQPHGYLYVGEGYESVYRRRRPRIDFEVIDHGIEHSQYFQGCGVSHSRFTDVATGIGYSAHEAGQDALECAWFGEGIDPEECDGWKELEETLAGLPGDVLPGLEAEHQSDEGSEVWHHVSIRWRIIPAKDNDPGDE